jgi:hypothetical protein
LRISASPSPASNSRAARLTWSRQPRGRPAGLPDRPWRTARPRLAHPVPPVLSGRDQASATPSIAIPHPLTDADAQESTMLIWQLRDYVFHPLRGSTGNSQNRERSNA